MYGTELGFSALQELMSLGFESAMLLLCSYCDPVRTLAHAKNEGYAVVDFKVTDLPFGEYSAEPKVHIIPPSCVAVKHAIRLEVDPL